MTYTLAPMRSTLFAVRDWMAERFSSVQYPPQRVAQSHAPGFFGFKYRMPLAMRFGLFMLSIFTLLFCAVALCFLGVILWAVITA
jgi:hypothetical protein